MIIMNSPETPDLGQEESSKSPALEIKFKENSAEEALETEGAIAIAPSRQKEVPETHKETCELFEQTRGLGRTRIISDAHLNPNDEEVIKLWDEYQKGKTGEKKQRAILEMVQAQKQDGVPMIEAFLKDCEDHKKSIGKVFVGGDIIDASAYDMWDDAPFKELLKTKNQQRKEEGLNALKIYDPVHLITWAIERLRENLNPETPIEIILGNHDIPRLKNFPIEDGWKIERGYLLKKAETGKFEKIKDWDDVPDHIKEHLKKKAISKLNFNPDEALYDTKKAEKIKEELEKIAHTKVLTCDFRVPVHSTLADGRKVILSHAPVVKGNVNLNKVIPGKNLAGNFIIPADVEVAMAFDQHSTVVIRGENVHKDARPATPLDYLQVGTAAATTRHKGDKPSFIDILNNNGEKNGVKNKIRGQIFVLGRDSDNKIGPVKLGKIEYKKPELV